MDLESFVGRANPVFDNVYHSTHFHEPTAATSVSDNGSSRVVRSYGAPTTYHPEGSIPYGYIGLQNLDNVVFGTPAPVHVLTTSSASTPATVSTTQVSGSSAVTRHAPAAIISHPTTTYVASAPTYSTHTIVPAATTTTTSVPTTTTTTTTTPVVKKTTVNQVTTTSATPVSSLVTHTIRAAPSTSSTAFY